VTVELTSTNLALLGGARGVLVAGALGGILANLSEELSRAFNKSRGNHVSWESLKEAKNDFGQEPNNLG
jgi:hypothetical protein